MIQRFTKTLVLIGLTGLTTIAEAQMKWAPAGPIYTAGRARNMIVDLKDPSGNTLYVGSTSSGIFKTTNGGVTWGPINDQGTVRNISYMAQAPDGTIYAATGEGFLRTGQKAKAQAGTGLYKLVGTNLVQVQPSSVTGTVINRVAVSPVNSNVIVITTNFGVMISNDGGGSFFQPSGIATATNISGQDAKFDNTGLLYCSVGNETNASLTGTNIAQTASQIYKSNDNTLTAFSKITPTASVLADMNYGRIELAVSPSNNQVVYASCANKNPTGASASASTLKALFVTYNGGVSWGLIAQGSPQLDPLSNGGTLASGDYAQTLLVSPTNPNQLFFGGYFFYVFTRTPGVSGDSDATPVGTWAHPGNPYAFGFQVYLHENIHDIKIIPGTPTKYYIVTDAGIYRTIDMVSINQQFPPTFQPFYKGLVTGQFNSVSIERYPVGANVTSTVNGTQVVPASGFIGGTGGNGLTYFSGTYSAVTQEINYLAGDVYNAEYSKILPDAAFATTGNGNLYRTTNIKTAYPALLNVNKYNGVLSKIAPTSEAFTNTGYTTGTPFKLWEWYGQVPTNPDSSYFYNDTLRFQASVSTVAELITATNFTFTANRPNKFALIDSIVIRTGTVQLPQSTGANSPNFNTGQDISIMLDSNYTNTGTLTTLTGTNVKVVGPSSSSVSPVITLNNKTLLDFISVTFSAPPFATKTQTSATINFAGYYRVFATVFYKYKAGDTLKVLDNNISTISNTYEIKLNRSLRWTYGSAPRKSTNPVAVLFAPRNPRVKVVTLRSARLAIALNNTSNTSNVNSIMVSRAPLSLNDPLSLVRVSVAGNPIWSDDANGNATTTNTVTVIGKPTILEWSKSGTELYYATDANNVYRVSHITEISDNSPISYNGKFFTEIYKYNQSGNNAPGFSPLNTQSPYRTTLIGSFDKPVTSISVAQNDTVMLLTFNNPAMTGSTGIVMMTTKNVKKSNTSNIGWVKKDATFPGLNTYCSLMEKNDYKRVFVGTENGIFYTNDITAGSVAWSNVNDNITNELEKLPNVQVFDIKQQTLESWDCYNSGQIYVATNGRGVWTNNEYIKYFVVGTEEYATDRVEAEESRLNLFPNPASGKVSVAFNSMQGETAQIQVMDLSGRVVTSENLGKLESGEYTHTINTSDLNTGVYIVNVSSNSGVKRIAKLVVTK